MIYLGFMIGLLPVIFTFLLLGFFAGRMAKRRGKNPWVWGGAIIVLLTAITWQKLPRWAGKISAWDLFVMHSFTTQQSKIVDPNAIEHFMLRSQRSHDITYAFSLPARYRAEHPTEYLIEVVFKYPSMEASPGSLFPNERVVDLYITTDHGYAGRPQLYLKQVAANKVFGEYLGKQGNYDVYQVKNAVTGGFYKTWLFTAKDGQMVMVDSSVSDAHSAWRDIGSDMAVRYNFSSMLGNDFIKIDETVVSFIKTHLQLQTTQTKGNDK